VFGLLPNKLATTYNQFFRIFGRLTRYSKVSAVLYVPYVKVTHPDGLNIIIIIIHYFTYSRLIQDYTYES
jgi:hypothetical protein